MSTVIIGGGGRAAIQKLIDAHPRMTAEQRAAAVNIEHAFVEAVDKLCREVEQNPP